MAIGDTVTISYAGPEIPVRIVGQVFDGENSGPPGHQHADPGARPTGLAAGSTTSGCGPGTHAASYAHAEHQARTRVLRPAQRPAARPAGHPRPDPALTLLLAVVAALGVLNTVVLYTRDRVHDLGVFKAVGMTPGRPWSWWSAGSR